MLGLRRTLICLLFALLNACTTTPEPPVDYSIYQQLQQRPGGQDGYIVTAASGEFVGSTWAKSWHVDESVAARNKRLKKIARSVEINNFYRVAEMTLARGKKFFIIANHGLQIDNNEPWMPEKYNFDYLEVTTTPDAGLATPTKYDSYGSVVYFIPLATKKDVDETIARLNPNHKIIYQAAEVKKRLRPLIHFAQIEE